ncbi:MAG TPA: hypothetical protein VNZ49_10835 [Bacteroidia bacterium]|jgi:hypothetical protein|nr:hypothetical protein [Bacteroidia bacterium]
MKRIISISFVLLSLIVTSCWYNHKWEDMHPQGQTAVNSGGCDSAGVISYSNQIKPMLNTSCNLNTGSGCHDVTASFDYNIATNVQSDALSGTLMARLRMGLSKPTHMPKGSGFLPTCDTTKFRKWVIQGAPINN